MIGNARSLLDHIVFLNCDVWQKNEWEYWLSFPPSLRLLKSSLIDYCGFWLPTWPEGSAEKSLLCAHSCHLTSEWGLWEALLCNPWSVCMSAVVAVCSWVVVAFANFNACVCAHFFSPQGNIIIYSTSHMQKTTTDPSAYCRKSNTAPRLPPL